MKRFGLVALGLVMFGPAANAQSFDCADARRADERTICDSRVLSRLDDELSEVYEDALSDASRSERKRLKADQLDWISIRRACRSRERCIKRVYRDRISELEDARFTTRGRIDDETSRDGTDRWKAIGSVDVRRRAERLVIPVGFSRGRFDALQLRARDSGARIRRVIIVYGNGERHRVKFRRRFRAGQLSEMIELRTRGRGRFIERVVVVARTVGLGDRRGRVEVIGRQVSRGGVARGRGYRDDDREERLDRDEVLPREDRYDDRREDRYGSLDRDDLDLDRDRAGDLNRDSDRDDDLGDRTDTQDKGSIKDRLSDFVNDVFHRTAEMSPSELRQTYARRVDYYGQRRKPISEVISDKQSYGERWPDRAFRVKKGTLRVEEIDEADVYDVTYEYDFHVRGGSRESKGNGETTLRVDTSGERFVILRENGKVLKRY